MRLDMLTKFNCIILAMSAGRHEAFETLCQHQGQYIIGHGRHESKVYALFNTHGRNSARCKILDHLLLISENRQVIRYEHGVWAKPRATLTV